ncbi:hypothetical protein CA607_03200 [Caulobacter vibrioides]|nr:hypothetical protein CA607_03200 [Caulobacter vibrioides]
MVNRLVVGLAQRLHEALEILLSPKASQMRLTFACSYKPAFFAIWGGGRHPGGGRGMRQQACDRATAGVGFQIP